MNCLENTVKYALLFLNFVFAMGALAMLIAGGMVQGYIGFYRAFFVRHISCPSVLLITVGVALFAVTFYGCCGIVRESHNMITKFAAALLLVSAVQLVAGALLCLPHHRADVGPQLQASMQGQQQVYVLGAGGDQKEARRTWDCLQRAFECCGTESYVEWLRLSVLPPNSCLCNDLSNPECDPNHRVFRNGCYDKLAEAIRKTENALAGIAFVGAAFELIGAVLALLLARTAKRQKLW